MKIALIGYGKMGKTIERLALQSNHEIVLKIDKENADDLTQENLRMADVAIEFTQPETAYGNIVACLEAGVPVVVGTTAWLDKLDAVKKLCSERNGAFFHASNFSIGVNIFFAVNRYLAGLMNEQPQYDVRMKEVHHTQKLDHPSGTALTLAEGILKNLSRKSSWTASLGKPETAPAPAELSIVSKRIDPAPGTHVVTWASDIDTIEISHTAHSREGFAAGALAAAEWIIGKKGSFEMKDMLGF